MTIKDEAPKRSTVDGNYISIGLAVAILGGVGAIYNRLNSTEVDLRGLFEVTQNNSRRIEEMNVRLGKIETAIVHLKVDLAQIRVKDRRKGK